MNKYITPAHCFFNKQLISFRTKYTWSILFLVENSTIKINLLPNPKASKRYNKNTCKSGKVGDHSRGRPEGSLFNSYYTEV